MTIVSHSKYILLEMLHMGFDSSNTTSFIYYTLTGKFSTDGINFPIHRLRIGVFF